MAESRIVMGGVSELDYQVMRVEGDRFPVLLTFVRADGTIRSQAGTYEACDAPRNAATKPDCDARSQHNARQADQILASRDLQVVVFQACTHIHIEAILARFVHKYLTMT
jgi:hypothetical protein